MASGVVLIEFGADECVASQTMHRAVKALANARTGRLEVITLDAWDAPCEVVRFGVLSLPTVVLLVNGAERARITSALAALARWVDHLLEASPAQGGVRRARVLAGTCSSPSPWRW